MLSKCQYSVGWAQALMYSLDVLVCPLLDLAHCIDQGSRVQRKRPVWRLLAPAPEVTSPGPGTSAPLLPGSVPNEPPSPRVVCPPDFMERVICVRHFHVLGCAKTTSIPTSGTNEQTIRIVSLTSCAQITRPSVALIIATAGVNMGVTEREQVAAQDQMLTFPAHCDVAACGAGAGP